jgi:para-nitrobenzyl esterase
LANTVRAPVWRWLYTHADEHDPRLAPFKASHLLEDQFIWHADVQHLGHALTADETVLSKRMTAYWTNFAKHHDPNHSGLPHWPRYHPGPEPTLTLDNPIGVTHRYHDVQCAFLDTLPSPFPP